MGTVIESFTCRIGRRAQVSFNRCCDERSHDPSRCWCATVAGGAGNDGSTANDGAIGFDHRPFRDEFSGEIRLVRRMLSGRACPFDKSHSGF